MFSTKYFVIAGGDQAESVPELPPFEELPNSKPDPAILKTTTDNESEKVEDDDWGEFGTIGDEMSSTKEKDCECKNVDEMIRDSKTQDGGWTVPETVSAAFSLLILKERLQDASNCFIYLEVSLKFLYTIDILTCNVEMLV